MSFRYLMALGLAAVLGAAQPASAQDAQAGQIIFDAPPPARSPADAGLVAIDTRVYERALQQKTPADLAKMESELRDVLDHVPTRFPMFETRRGQVMVRGDRETTAPVARALAEELLKTDPQTPVKISFEPNVYGFATLALASMAFERMDYERALRVLNVGASVQPDNPKIVAERARALVALGRLPEAMSAYMNWSQNFPVQARLSPADTAMMFRGVGDVLTEQKLYDAAQESYEAALKLMPGEPIATEAIKRLAQLKAAAN